MTSTKLTVFWFRRDLRLHDNAGLFKALTSGLPVLPIFIFDENILLRLEDPQDARVHFIYEQLESLHQTLKDAGSGLTVLHGDPVTIWRQLIESYTIGQVFYNRDYEPEAVERDARVKGLLETTDIVVQTCKDQVIFEPTEILKEDGTPYTVFTPYSKKWLSNLRTGVAVNGHTGEVRSAAEGNYSVPYFPSQELMSKFLSYQAPAFPSIESLGFKKSGQLFPPIFIKQGIIRQYDITRNFPSLAEGTSRLGVHYRFGTVSIREKLINALDLNMTYVNELIWREFFTMILAWFPRVVGHAFRPKYDDIPWRQDETAFKRWCEGKTGYPLVDAGMRELNVTGYQHNRVRMVTASFLTKHLLIDWRWGEAYFAQKLLDFELSSNNGNWQWAAGCGTDAAPYFRIFNPVSQQEKFDKELEYIKKWVPEYGTPAYDKPIVEHTFARERCLSAYKKALKE
jgi:deoxyribodipyrimidine photo-lyase